MPAAEAGQWRSRRLPGIVLLCMTMLAVSTLPVAGRAATLTLDAVLASSAEAFPGILEALAERQGVAADVLSAQGAFDLVFSAESFNRATGFYDGRFLEGKASQPLGPLGGELYGSYGLSRGDFPIYEDELFTNRGGKAKVGVLFSLLRDRDIDERRFELADSRLALRSADLDLLLTRIGVQRQAIGAYWRWVAQGHQLAVYEDLLAIAEARDKGLVRQVESGARAEIQLTENRQNLTRRQSLVTDTLGQFRRAAYSLAFYLRDEAGAPRVPGRDELPPSPDADELVTEALPTVDDLSALIQRRPELGKLRVALQRAERRLALNENDLRPKLDLNVELQQPFGSIGEGGASRDDTDTLIGLTFSVPLQRRSARAAVDATRARMEQLEQRRRRIADQLELELLDLLLDLDVSQQLAVLAAREFEQARIMEAAENRRFESGASDFFLVNVREERSADASVRFLQADLQQRLARAEFDAAVLNLERLGLEESSPTP